MDAVGKNIHHENILLIDDEPDIVECIKRKLERSGYHVGTAANGKDGLDIVSRLPFDLIVTDIAMPIMDGYTLCRELKKAKTTAHIPVIISSAKSDVEELHKYFGVEDYLIKPFNDQQMLDKIDFVLHHKLKEASVEVPPQGQASCLNSKILIVSNGYLNDKKLMVSAMEQCMGLDIEIIYSSVRLIDDILRINPRVLFMDVLTKDNNSAEVIKSLRAVAELKNLTIIIYSSLSVRDMNRTPNLEFFKAAQKACMDAGASYQIGALTGASLYLVFSELC